MAESLWYYADGGGQVGPVPWEQLWRLAQAGAVRPDQLVWTDGMEQWQPAASVPTLLPTAPPPGPAEPPSLPNGAGQPTNGAAPYGQTAYNPPGYGPAGYGRPSYQEADRADAATAGLVLGICSIVFVWCPLVGVALGITGIVFSVKGKASSAPVRAGFGFWMSIVGTALSAILFILSIASGLRG